MVDLNYVEKQLKEIKFNAARINRAEVKELQNILLPDETIYECVNGYYEGGVALLVATDIRVLLIDKKPMGFLNVDDLRFDMISDIDYSHRAFGAQIAINCGMKNLVFKSYNQPRLRKLIGHVQHRMSEIKREQNDHASKQKEHLEEINKQLQIYLMAQQQQLERQMAANQQPQPLKPSPQLADYLFAQRLLEDFQSKTDKPSLAIPEKEEKLPEKIEIPHNQAISDQALLEEMAEAGRLEVFGGTDKVSHNKKLAISQQPLISSRQEVQGADLTPFKIAYAKLPYLLKTRRYKQPFTP